MYDNCLCCLYLLSLVFVVFVVHVVFFVLVVFVVICQWLPKWPTWAAKKQFIWKTFHFWVGSSSSFLALACRVWQKVKWSWFVRGRFKITLFMNLLLLQPTYCVVLLANQVFLGPHLWHKRMINWLYTWRYQNKSYSRKGFLINLIFSKEALLWWAKDCIQYIFVNSNVNPFYRGKCWDHTNQPIYSKNPAYYRLENHLGYYLFLTHSLQNWICLSQSEQVKIKDFQN